MSQSFLTPDLIAKDTLMMLVNNCVMASLVDRRYEANFGPSVNGSNTFTLRKPVRFRPVNQAALSLQDINEQSVVMTVDKQAQVAWTYSSTDRSLTIDMWRERYGKPAAETIHNQIDMDLLALAADIPTVVGTPTVTPSTFATSVQLTGQALMEQGVPKNEPLNLVVNAAAEWSMAGAQSNAYVTKVSENALVQGYLNMIGNQKIYGDQNVQTQAASTYGGVPLTNAVTAQTGSSLITDGWTATSTTLAVGAVFTIAGVYAVNPQSRVSTGKLAQFVVTTATVTDGSGNSTIAIYPPITPTGPYQNVTNGAANDKAITVLTGATTAATTINNIAFARQAFGLVTVPMTTPTGNGESGFAVYKGIGLRFIFNWYDIVNDRFINRYDVLYGVKTYYPELAVRLLG